MSSQLKSRSACQKLIELDARIANPKVEATEALVEYHSQRELSARKDSVDTFSKINHLNVQLSKQSPLILAVDDDRDNLLLIDLVLSYFDYNLVMTANTQTAISMVKRDKPDLILLGVNSPGIREIRLFCQLKQDPQTCSIPIVALSAISNPDYLSYLLCLGCDYCLTKPYLLEDLQQLICGRDRLFSHASA